MEYRQLGNTDLRVSELCLGSMQFGWTADEATSFEVLSAAYQAGVNFIDTADIYSNWVPGNPGGVSEMIIGKWIKKQGVPRDELIIATKVRGQMGDDPKEQGLSRHHILRSVEGSLQRMGIDHIDLYQAHWTDEDTPIEETMQVFDDLVRQGKVRYVGCSNYPAWRLMQALWASERGGLVRYDCLQPNYNLVHRHEFERELADVCRSYSLGVIPYSPLAGGFLTGKYKPDEKIPDDSRGAASESLQKKLTDRNFRIVRTLEEIGKVKGGYSSSQVALAWLLTDPLITSPIVGPKNLVQLQDNLGAVGLRLLLEEKQKLDEVSDWSQS